MNQQRRAFLNQITLMAGAAALNKPLASMAAASKHIIALHAAQHAITVYSTNDLHGQSTGLNAVKTLLANQETKGLLLDGGDFLHSAQSSSQHIQVIDAMNAAGYHAATIGNNELAHGQQYLASLIPLMRFGLVNCNYQFDAALNELVKPYSIFHSGPYKVGITGVGHELKGVAYTDAIASANWIARLLKEQKNCDMVICLSHLGYKQEGGRPDNRSLARASEHIDMIVGGHNRKLLAGPVVLHNKLQRQVILSHAAWDGLMIGKTTFGLKLGTPGQYFDARYLMPGQPAANYAAALAALRLEEKAA